MFISDSLIFVELHKTAGSHIGRCLNKILDGAQVGKHNMVPVELHERFILGSIRNPWDWYVSLWGYGCDKKGSVYSQTTRRYDFNYYWRQLNKEMGRKWLNPAQYTRQLLADTCKPVQQWKEVYADSSNPELFRQWLKLVLSTERRFDLGEGYGFSPISQHSGLLTYRYCKLFTRLGADLYRLPELANQSNLANVWDTYSITNFIVKSENLEADLLKAFACANVPLSEEQKQFILQGKNEKTNTSSRKSVEFYYDSETIQLIAEKEKLIISQYNYSPPQLV